MAQTDLLFPDLYQADRNSMDIFSGRSVNPSSPDSGYFGYKTGFEMPNLRSSDLSSALAMPTSGYAGLTNTMPAAQFKTPSLEGGFGTTQATSPQSLGYLNYAAMLGALAKAIAPYRTDYKGNKIPSFGEKLGDSAEKMAQAQLMAKALSAQGGAGNNSINPYLMMMLFGGGK